MKTLTRLGVATTATAVLAAGIALPAQAQSTPAPAARSGLGLDAVKALATARIDGRLETLRALQLAVTNAAHLTSADRSALGSLLTSDVSGLTALRGKVAAESAVAAVRADETVMVDQYRVYMLVVPKVHLTDAFDIEAAAVSALRKVHDKLAERVAKQPGGATAAEQAQLADLQTRVQNAEQAESGKTATLLAIQPGADATAIRGAITPLVDAAKSARKDLKQARDDAKKVRAELK
ncbi:hypothetical protein KGA66_00010 [Actinocrinis puniceicyclus]|uniref:Uncharacterized protein n=1 Tax=Actinocrinis puniceicyclus TaxID=977794 RepID=A0A8J7WFW4_9ACTN|nr:hypothetical protein [Actinocrinis puniceicyclus]MBS2961406.1 hypothetical protein [Actinocrinis puniceicyclus]